VARASTRRALGLQSKRGDKLRRWLRDRIERPGLVALVAALCVGLGLGIGGVALLTSGGPAPVAPAQTRLASESPKPQMEKAEEAEEGSEHFEKDEAEAAKAHYADESPTDPSAWLPPRKDASSSHVVEALGRPSSNPTAAPPASPPPPISPPVQTAKLPPTNGTHQAWQRFAIAPPPIKGRPMIAMVIDDLGVDKKRSERLSALPGPLTTSWMSYAENVDKQAQYARDRGHEILLHYPMEPENPALDAGPDVLKTSYTEERIRQLLRQGIDRLMLSGFVGVNNHMGSKFSADPEGMRVVMEELKSHGLLFLDSLTSPKSVGAEAARRAGVPYAVRDVFVDNSMDVEAVMEMLQKVEQVARRNGSAIAIGHPHDDTIEALRRWLPTLEAKGFVLVPLTTVMRSRMAAGQG